MFWNEKESAAPFLKQLAGSVYSAYSVMAESFASGGKLLICGNGGSAADADHIVGELMKSFERKRPLAEAVKTKLSAYPEGVELSKYLQQPLAAINLSAHTALLTAFSNDVRYTYAFAQQVIGYGKPGDVLMAISTSGNSENVALACVAAKAADMRVVAMTGRGGGRMAELSDAAILAPDTNTHRIQDIHSVVYHILCILLEMRFWPA